MLSDMGQALDWVHGLAVQNKWKSMKIRIGPGMYLFIGAHPEAAQAILRSGTCVTIYSPAQTILGYGMWYMSLS